MDRKINKKGKIGAKLLLGVVAIVALSFLSFKVMTREKQATLEKKHLTIKTVKFDHFEDMAVFNGIVEPLNTVLVNTIESGAVRIIFVDDGQIIKKGQALVELYNPNTEFQYLTQETAIIEQINNLRNTRISIKNQQLNLDKQLAEIEHNYNIATRRYRIDTALYASATISTDEFEASKENFRYQCLQKDIIHQSVMDEKSERKEQLQRLNESISKMEVSLVKLQQNKENFIIRAGGSGKLSSFEPVIGKSYQAGESLGKIDLLDGYKVRALVDEYYATSIFEGQKAILEIDNESFDLAITKVLSEVTNGKFEVEMKFANDTPSAIKRGMGISIKIYLSDTKNKTILLPKGGFYQSTGGHFVYVLIDDNTAIKQPIRIGKSNPYYYEILEGLQEGDKVITSSYENYEDLIKINLK